MKTVKEKLQLLRIKMKENNISAYIVCTQDFHGSEYVGDYFKEREYLSGFTGSAGTIVVLEKEAALWTDGRYFLQAEKELEAVLKALKKFEIHPCKCMADAEKQVTELTSKLKLVSVSDISYEEVKGYKGRPKKDEEKVTVSVIVRANAQIDTEAVKDTVEKATYYVLCTNDTGVNGP